MGEARSAKASCDAEKASTTASSVVRASRIIYIVNMVHNVIGSAAWPEILSELLLVTSLMAEDTRRGLAEVGLTEARAQLLWQVGSSTSLTQRELAQRLAVTPRNVTTLIDALEASGFVRRKPHPDDRRAVLVVLTERGATTYKTLAWQMEVLAAQLFADEPAEGLATFRGVLQRVASRLGALTA